MYYDSHCHIYKEYYEDIDALISQLNEEKIDLLINNGCDSNTNKEVLDLIKKYEAMYGAIGIHPEYVNDYTKADLLFVKNHINDDKIIAVGEIGLDYHYSKEDKDKQIKLFEEQLKIAEDACKPVIIHSREATKDTIDILNNYSVKGSIHSFSGSYETATIYIKKGFVLGVNGVITFKNSNLKDTIKKVGLENIIIETDSPYLSPHPLRGTKNSPKNVKIIVDFLADLFNVSALEVEKITSENLHRIFDI